MLKIVRLIALVVLLAITSASVARAQVSSALYVPDELIVKFSSENDARVSRSLVTTQRRVTGYDNMFVVKGLPTDVLDKMYAASPGVEWTSPNYIVFTAQGPTDIGDSYYHLEDGTEGVIDDTFPFTVPLVKPVATVNDSLVGQQYSLTKMDVFRAWDATKGNGVTVGIVDSGADFTHPDLAGKFDSRGRDVINNDYDATDDQGHGTHVAGIIAASTNNSQGVAGVGYNTKFLMCKGLSASGSGPLDKVAECVRWLTDQGVRIINMSLGCACPSFVHGEYVNYAYSRGTLIIAAAGNDGNGVTRFYPASETNVLGIGASDQNDQRSSFSNYGPNVDAVAPGSGILSTVRGNGYQSWNGTSMASPNAAGVAALVLAVHPSYTVEQLRSALLTTTDNIGSVNEVGAGRLNAARAVGSASPGPSPTALPTSPAPRTPTPPPSSDFEVEVVRLMNIERANNGLSPLRVDARLGAAADFHNNWMAQNNCFSHNCPGEPPVMTRMRDAGYPVITGGENIAAGYTTPASVMAAWMNSSGHRAAILNTIWPDTGCGFLRSSQGSYGFYWSCEFAFGSDSSATPTRAPATTVPTATRTATSAPTRTATRVPTRTVAVPIPTASRTPTPNPTRATPIPTRTPGTSKAVIVTLNFSASYATEMQYNYFCQSNGGVSCTTWRYVTSQRIRTIYLASNVSADTVNYLRGLCLIDRNARCEWSS